MKPAALALEMSARRTTYCLVARELAPESGLEIDVLADCDCADVGNRRGGVASRAVERLGKVAARTSRLK